MAPKKSHNKKAASSSPHPSVSESKPQSPSVSESKSQSVNKGEEVEGKGIEVSFKDMDCLPLSHQDKIKFFAKMKDVVVMLQVWIPNSDICMTGSGVVLKGGYILTCHHILDKGCEKIVFFDINDFEGYAKEEYVDKKLDLALLKIIEDEDKPNKDYHYAKFGDESSIEDGMQVFTIGHPEEYYFSFLSGHLCFPCKNPHRANDNPECRFSRIAWLTKVGENFRHMRKDVPLLQINNFHLSSGYSGGPIFDACGTIIGVVIGFLYDSDVGVHIHSVKKFINDANIDIKFEV